LRSDHTQQSHLQVLRGDKKICGHVGLCTVEIRYAGLRDLTAADVLKPITIEIENVTRVLRVTAKATRGWDPIRVPDLAPRLIELPIRHLSPGETIRLDVFYEHDAVDALRLRAHGQITNGDVLSSNIRRTLARYVTFIVYLGSGIGLGVANSIQDISWQSRLVLIFGLLLSGAISFSPRRTRNVWRLFRDCVSRRFSAENISPIEYEAEPELVFASTSADPPTNADSASGRANAKNQG
jgi:hypothetical protein